MDEHTIVPSSGTVCIRTFRTVLSLNVCEVRRGGSDPLSNFSAEMQPSFFFKS